MENENRKLIALTDDHIRRVTGLSKHQLRAWDNRGFFVPKHAYDDRSKAYSRIYSFEDAVGLRLIAKLRQKPYNISIKRLERLGQQLKKSGIDSWANAKIWIVKGEPHYKDPSTGEIVGAETGQCAMLDVIEVIEEVQEKIKKLQSRDKSTIGKISRNRHVLRNSWVIAGTRIPVATILRYYDAGYTIEDIKKEYPVLTKKDIDAAIQSINEFAING